jgi:transaldolase
MNPLLQLSRCGQSYWLDNLTRDMIRSGELERRAAEDDLRGVTSNPATFRKAIAESELYDEEIGSLARRGLGAPEIHAELMISDVRAACDLLRPVHEATGDGFVSLEVSPHLAHDTEGTLEEARRFWSAVDRPNLFIKIPGTREGVPAIEEALFEGININITLLFSIESYEAVARAYIRALERRLAAGRAVDGVDSVASFFLSRIDVLTDQLLEHRKLPPERRRGHPAAEELAGKVGIANAKLAYQSFKRIFAEASWAALERRGARLQRPLWASTGTKNPKYRDTMYVEPLVGRHTVNTMPEATIAAFAAHGIVEEDAVEKGVEEAEETLRALEKLGIDFHCLTWQLEHEGVQKFIEPFDGLMAHLEAKLRKLGGGAAHRTGRA